MELNAHAPHPRPAPFSRALLVEDEPNVALALEIALGRLGIATHRAATLQEARAAAAGASPGFELVLLDRKLPDGDGLTLCAELRRRSFGGAILVLTASGQTEDRVLGLETGADDYLPKPFAWTELEARIRALARRVGALNSAHGPQRDEPLPWSLDRERLRILGRAGWVTLTPLEFKLASHLIASGGAIVSRDDLLKSVWGFTLLPKTRTVDHFLGRLRKRFETNPEAPQHFLTARGAGYRFER